MKKSINLFSALVIFALASCSNEPTETKKEVIVVPEAKKEKVIVAPEPKREEEKPTTISIDKGGVEVESKKVKVKVKPNN